MATYQNDDDQFGSLMSKALSPLAAAGIDPHQGPYRPRRKNNHSTRRPGASASQQRVANHHPRPAIHINRLQLPIHEESQGTAVW